MGINEEYNYGDIHTTNHISQNIRETDKEFEKLCKKITVFGCCIIILLIFIYISLIFIILSLK